jgi:hypothetical protein
MKKKELILIGFNDSQLMKSVIFNKTNIINKKLSSKF